MNRTVAYCLMIALAAWLGGCSTTTRECASNTLQVTIECGDQPFTGGKVEITRPSDGKTFENGSAFTCPGKPYVLRLNVADYKAGDKYLVRFTTADNENAAFSSEIDAPAGCLPWKLRVGTLPDGGQSSAPDDGGGKGGAGGIVPIASVEAGASCGAAVDCKTGFCSDGVCCETECAGSCSACNLPASPGLCRPVAKGDKPAQPKICATSEASSCGLDGTCDGQGDCAKYPDGATCEKGTCDGAGTQGRKVCQKGACTATLELVCAPSLCNPATGLCFAECSSNDQCISGRTCEKKSCGEKQLGGTCTTDAECLSGNCADGFCCNTPCKGACESCGLAGKLGECAAVAKGVADPHGVCKAADISTCKSTGTCDGNKGCAVFEANAVCKASTCSGNTFAAPSKCDGAGLCVSGSTVACAPFACAATACVQTCTADNECVGGNLCINGSCGKKDEGSTCETDAQCKSTFCRDKVCCEGECAGNCRTCNAAGKAGKCTLSTIGASDPRGVCTDATAPSCKNDGKCDGAGNCRNYPAGTECVAQSCNAGTNTGDFRHECNGSGTCAKTKDPVSCAPGRCGGNACTLQCSKTEDCVAPNTCVGNLCGKKPLGQTCNTPSECQSGNCADGFCCDEACTGACKACDASGSVGKCSLVAAGQSDPNGVCAATPGGTCGTSGLCNAGGGCAYHSAATSCGTATCNAAIGTFTPAPRCNGSGTCGNVSQMGCNRFACNSNGCLTSCAGSGDCANGSACVGGQCVQKVADGSACKDDVECISGACRTYYFDEDNDGFGRDAGEKFCGSLPPEFYRVTTGDCCDKDKNARPNQQSPVRGISACNTGDFNCNRVVTKYVVNFDKSDADLRDLVIVTDEACIATSNRGKCDNSIQGFTTDTVTEAACGKQVREKFCSGPPNSCMFFAYWGPSGVNDPYLLCL